MSDSKAIYLKTFQVYETWKVSHSQKLAPLHTVERIQLLVHET